MDENYLDNLYNELKSNPKFDFRLDQETFNDRMLNDTNYRDKVYTNVKMFSSNNEFKVDPNTFYTRVLESSKKKSQSEIGSQTTQPGSGSENAQFLPQGLRPEDQQFQEEQQVSEKPKRVIYRGEGTREALETQFAPEVKKETRKANVVEATKPVSLESKYKNVEKLETVNDKVIETFQSENRTRNFTPKDIENNYNEYAKNALDDYLDYLNFVDRGGSQYQKTKEKLEYYKSLGDKLFNDENYADEYKNYVNLQKEAILNVNKQDAKYVNRLKDKYDWGTFNKKTSEVELKLSDIEGQIKKISSDGGPLTPLQQKKYDDLLSQYNQIQTDYSKFSNELGITEDVLNQMSNSASRLSASQKAFNNIEDEDNVNSNRLKEYKNQLLSNKKAQEEFYGDKDQAWYEQFGKGVLVAGQQLGSSLIKGSISMVGDVPQLLTDAIGIEGYGVTDRIAEAADDINSYVDLIAPQLEDQDFPGFVKASSVIGNGLGSVGTFILSGGGAAKAAQGILKTSTKKGLQIANKVGVFTAASSLSSGQLYDQLIEEGFNPTEASRYALAGGVVMGAVEMLVPEDELLSNSVRRTFTGALKNKNTVKEATEEALKFLYNRTSDITKTSLKEGGEEAVGQFAQDLSLQAASSISGKEIDGLWEVQPYVDNFLAGGGVGGVIELLKFGTRNSKYGNKFKESVLNELAENYDDISNKIAQIKPEEFDKIGEKYAKLKNVNNALKDIPGFENLSHADKSHILALAYNKQVILDGVKQSGLDKSNFENELNDIEAEIQKTLNKPKENAVQERSAEEVLPRQQGETTETGGQPQGMGQGVQGEEVAQQAETEAKRQDEIKKRGLDRLFPVDIDETTPEGKKLAKEKANQEKAIEELDSELSVLEQQKSTPKAKELQLQEEVSVNREPIAEDIAPEQKAKIEEANTKDEDESVSEIYDFNDEIKSVGTKEQFKAFLRSLSPKGVFSRIAWHNSDKEALQPREGQYYANSRRNAEETYKRDFTHPAIIFGNSPQKMDFDQVQEFDINDVKSQGNDIVITDDLSPAIGAEMNYREFIPSSADQIIPIGTKENIEAFKSFVEQQKSATTPQVTPQAQEVTFEKLSDEDKKSIDSISNDLEEYLKNNPEQYFTGEKKDGKVNVKVKGGLLDIRAAALNSDKRKSVPTPTSLPFLPKIINLKHLARNKSDKKSILKNGFNENQVSLDSAIPGIYFSSDDWSTMGRFDRSTKDSLFASIENEGLIYFDSAKEFEDFLKENNLPVRARRLTKDQVDFLRSKGIKGILLREDYASGERNELIVIDKSIIKDISESEKEITDIPSSFVEPKSISKAYYLAKKNNSNPELVEAVEKAIGKKSINKNEEVKPTVEAQETEQEVAPEEEAKVVEEASKNEGIKPKNMQDLIGIYRKVFGLSFPKAVSAAMVSNRLIKQMAKRAGVTTEQMYQRLSFQKANEKDLPQGVKMQVDAWHGSPYEFDKFQTQFMGKGEGAQAFGWGLYFTDLKNIAVSYAKSLAKTTFKGQPISDNPIFEKLLISLDAENSDFYNYETGEIKNLNKFKEYIDDMYNYSKEQLDKGVDENHPLVSRMMSDYEYSQSKIDEVKANLEKLKNYDYKSLKQSLIDAGAYEEVANKLVDDFIKRRESEKKFLYEAMKYQASRASRLDKAINLIKNDLKSDANYYKYLKENFDKFNLSRNLYKVSLHEGKTPDQYTWLEWDKKPNKEQVSKLLSKLNQEQLDKSFYYGISPDETNGSFYKKLTRALGSDKAASIFLLENGIDGIKYPAESISRGVTSETARGFNYVVFDENTVSIKEVVKFQKDAEKARGAMMMGMDGQAIIYALTDANVSTPLHELAHVFEHYLTDAEKNQIIKAAKTKGWTTETSEYFARGFEKYLAEGKSSDPIFEKFKQFLLDIYKAIKGSPIDVKLNKQMKDIYAQMLGEDLTAELGEDIEEQETKLEEMEVSEANLVSEYEQIKNMSGIDKIDAMNKWKEKYGELANRYMYIENNYDKLAEQFKAIRTCEFE